MTRHILRLHPQPFDEIAAGSKTVELRLYDEKRQQIQVGDELMFIDRRNPDNNVMTNVTGLVQAKNFHELLADDEVLRKSGPNAKWLEEQLAEFYGIADQHEHGVVGIEFVLAK